MTLELIETARGGRKLLINRYTLTGDVRNGKCAVLELELSGIEQGNVPDHSRASAGAHSSVWWRKWKLEQNKRK